MNEVAITIIEASVEDKTLTVIFDFDSLLEPLPVLFSLTLVLFTPEAGLGVLSLLARLGKSIRLIIGIKAPDKMIKPCKI
jgi:hypothetical protein